MLIFGSIVLICGILALVFSIREEGDAEAILGSIVIILFAVALFCIWAFAPNCELARVDTQVVMDEQFLVSEKICYRNIRPSKTWTYVYFTEIRGVK